MYFKDCKTFQTENLRPAEHKRHSSTTLWSTLPTSPSALDLFFFLLLIRFCLQWANWCWMVVVVFSVVYWEAFLKHGGLWSKPVWLLTFTFLVHVLRLQVKCIKSLQVFKQPNQPCQHRAWWHLKTLWMEHSVCPLSHARSSGRNNVINLNRRTAPSCTDHPTAYLCLMWSQNAILNSNLLKFLSPFRP